MCRIKFPKKQRAYLTFLPLFMPLRSGPVCCANERGISGQVSLGTCSVSKGDSVPLRTRFVCAEVRRGCCDRALHASASPFHTALRSNINFIPAETQKAMRNYATQMDAAKRGIVTPEIGNGRRKRTVRSSSSWNESVKGTIAIPAKHQSPKPVRRGGRRRHPRKDQC